MLWIQVPRSSVREYTRMVEFKLKNCLFIFEEMYSGKEYALFTTLSRRQRREVSPLNADSVWTDLVLAMANWASVTKNALNFIRRFN